MIESHTRRTEVLGRCRSTFRGLLRSHGIRIEELVAQWSQGLRETRRRAA
jgi:hypothetical protein